jgi:uncharacterized damage-inducible protein DinB
MTLLEHFRRQFDYDFWANTGVLRNLASTPNPTGQSTRLMAHIVAAEHLWLERLQKSPSHLPVWPDFSLDQCGEELRTTESAWRSYLEALQENDLATTFSYTNSKGEVWKSSVADILSHVVLHSSYHRGQIALEVRRGGSVPAYTDFIHAARQGLLE